MPRGPLAVCTVRHHLVSGTGSWSHTLPSVMPAVPGELEALMVLVGNLCSLGQARDSLRAVIHTPLWPCPSPTHPHLMDHLESFTAPHKLHSSV